LFPADRKSMGKKRDPSCAGLGGQKGQQEGGFGEESEQGQEGKEPLPGDRPQKKKKKEDL